MIQNSTFTISLQRLPSTICRLHNPQHATIRVARLHSHTPRVPKRDNTHCASPSSSRHRPPRRTFTTTSIRAEEPKPSHYEVLRVPPNATPAELKKQFYVLSKETHPDRNRSDPNAAERFGQISESYSVLADPKKRERYDRDLARTQPASRRGGAGSYAGSRPASGLSKRRSAFKGPPPSYFSHGGGKANSEGGWGPEGPTTAENLGGQYTTDQEYNGSPFSTASVFRTQTHEDVRRRDRRAAAMAAAQAEVEDYDSNFWARFVIVGGIVVLGVSLGSLIVGMGIHGPRTAMGASSTPSGKGPAGGLLRGDGSKRGEPKNEWTKG